MQIHNYVRPLWQNGPHVVHDASARVRSAFDLLFEQRRPAVLDDADDDALVRIRRVRAVGITVAWIQLDVELPVAGTGFSYRRARFLHALAVEERPGEPELTRERARALFETVYGRDLRAGIRTAQRWIHDLVHPTDADRGCALFVDGMVRPRPFEASERRGPERARRVDPAPSGGRRDIGRVHLAETASAPTEALFGPPSEVPAPVVVPDATPPATAADAPEPVRSAVEPAPAPTPVEAFDRAWARHAAAAAAAAPCAPPPAAPPPAAAASAPRPRIEPSPATSGSPPPVESSPAPRAPAASPAPEDPGAGPEVAPSGGAAAEPASLSALLRGRLSKAWPVDPDAETRPTLDASRS